MSEINWITVKEAEESLAELLNEEYDSFKFNGGEYLPSQILMYCDPIHWQQALRDHIDALASMAGYFIKGLTDPAEYE